MWRDSKTSSNNPDVQALKDFMIERPKDPRLQWIFLKSSALISIKSCFQDRAGESDESQFNENSPTAIMTVEIPDREERSPTKEELLLECKAMMEVYRQRVEDVLEWQTNGLEDESVTSSGGEEPAGGDGKTPPCPLIPPGPPSDAEFRSPGSLSRSTLPRWSEEERASPTSSAATEENEAFCHQACAICFNWKRLRGSICISIV